MDPKWVLLSSWFLRQIFTGEGTEAIFIETRTGVEWRFTITRYIDSKPPVKKQKLMVRCKQTRKFGELFDPSLLGREFTGIY